MTSLSLTLRDLVWLATLLVSLALAYGRMRGELRHLEDTKIGRAEFHAFTDDLRSRLEDIRTTVVRLEQTLRLQHGRGESQRISEGA